MNKQQLAIKIWESANQMRSKIEANEYKDYILGFIFYKYLSEQEVRLLKDNGSTDEEIAELSESDEGIVDFIRGKIGYFISYSDLFSTWLKMGGDFDISNVRNALSAFTRLINPIRKKVFAGIFETLEVGLSKLGENSAAQTKAVRGLINLINEIPMDGKQDYDVLGFIYEYLISMFAANAGKKAGEFYTPHEVSVLMSEIVAHHLRDKKQIQIYDPTSGSGSLLINIGKSIAKHINGESNIKYYAQELKQNTYNLTRMNLVMRGILPDNIQTRNGDTLEDDWPYFDEEDKVNTYNPLYVDAVVSNPPYSQHWNPEKKENDPRYKNFGVAPKSKADYAFLLHDLYHIKPDGIMTIVLPHGVLFRGGEEGEIRKQLIENNHIETIIGLPANIFFGTGIPTIIMVLNQKRKADNVLVVDASKGFEKVGKNNKLRASDIKRIVDAVIARKNIDKFAKIVSKDEIRANEYNLNIPRYVDSSDASETWDTYASMFGGIPNTEIALLDKYWKAFPSLKETLFKSNSSDYSNIAVTDIREAIGGHSDIKKFRETFAKAFADFAHYLKQRLVDNIERIEVSKEEAIICDNLFGRFENISLVDKYKAYQILDDNWSKISADLEILQTDGIEAATKVDPHKVLKKLKKSKEAVEVQDGWVGRIMPFEFVQNTVLKEESARLKELEDNLAGIDSEIAEIIDSFSEDDKESEIFNETKDGFESAALKNEVKLIKSDKKNGEKFSDDSFESKVLKADKLVADGKALKAKIKSDKDKLESLTKEAIESLSQAQVLSLLEDKWITPILESINGLQDALIDELSTKIRELRDKYSETYSEIDAKIRTAESELSDMLSELVGNEFDMKALKEFQTLLNGD